MKKKHHLATRVIHAGQSPDPSTGAVMTPIYATSTYVAGKSGPAQRLRLRALDQPDPERLRALRRRSRERHPRLGFRFRSRRDVDRARNDRQRFACLVSDDLYGGTYRLFEKVRRRSANLDFTFIDMTDPSKIEAAIKPNTRMVWVETPSNPLLKLIDLEAVAKIARKHNAISVSDNTFASPWIQSADRTGFRHGDSFRHEISQRSLRHGRRRCGRRRQHRARGSACNSCRTRSVRSPDHSTAFSPCAD